MKKITIRKATIDDHPELLALEQQLIEAERPFNSILKAQGASYYNLQDLLTSSSSYFAVAEIDGVIIATGYGQIRESKPALKHDQHVYFGFMFVAPEYRGQGINKLIMNTLIEWGQENHFDDFYLDVYAENESAITAYKKAGFNKSVIEMKLNIGK